MKTRTVEYFRLWDNQTWDTDFIDVSADTPDDRLEAAIREAAGRIKWESDVPVVVGLYNAGEEEEIEQPDDFVFATAIEGLTKYYPELENGDLIQQIRERVAIPDTRNAQADYENVRDQVERLVQNRLMDNRL
jgi:hypothetical protein